MSVERTVVRFLLITQLGTLSYSNSVCLKDGKVDESRKCDHPTAHCVITSEGKSGGCIRYGRAICGRAFGSPTLSCDGRKNICCCQKGTSCDNSVTKLVYGNICIGPDKFRIPPAICKKPFPKCHWTDPKTGVPSEKECAEIDNLCKLGFPWQEGCVPNDLPRTPICIVGFPGRPLDSTVAPGCYCSGNLCNSPDNQNLQTAAGSVCQSSWIPELHNYVCLHFQNKACLKDRTLMPCQNPKAELFCKINRITGIGEGCVTTDQCKFWQAGNPALGVNEVYCSGNDCCCPGWSTGCYTNEFKQKYVCPFPNTQAKDCNSKICLDKQTTIICLPSKNPSLPPMCTIDIVSGEPSGCGTCPAGCDATKCCCLADKTICNSGICKLLPSHPSCNGSSSSSSSLETPTYQSTEEENNLAKVARDVGIFLGTLIVVPLLAIFIWWITKSKRNRVANNVDKIN